ncbi:Corrinoid/iron-sulfur protein large subunit [Fundidesulfovibrio magnetotacticus]|uniref:Corrinoid/iron-sulfur protein large subunit n=1 Tax=Fundidesulfovibrio magnetotacticus TaxID=2730080 RepID=A0A6V8LSW5_9BACT|nr:Corrinoid/iron-sulfur protein large subunit [Fundidesulfovibrio magnetotacticus]
MPEIPGYRRWHFVERFLETPAGPVPVVKTRLERPDRLGAALVRLGVGRGDYRVAPGLYAVGSPGPESPVLATANYKLTFDSLRRELSGLDAWLLVLDTRGVNVWCAAGKGTFGTRELVRRIGAVGLERVVRHRRVVVPQLGAPGVNAREVKAGSGFRVLFGPVRAADAPAYLAAGMKATPAMRRVDFPAAERVKVGLVEFANERKTLAWAAVAFFALAGLGSGWFSFARAFTGLCWGMGSLLLGFLAGNVLLPLLLPRLPGRAFSLKGAEAGILAGAAALLAGLPAAGAAGAWLGAVVGGSWWGMHFTGSSTYTSPTGVEREMRRAIPAQAAGLLAALALWRWGLGW